VPFAMIFQSAPGTFIGGANFLSFIQGILFGDN
jgi:hypothetical protein